MSRGPQTEAVDEIKLRCDLVDLVSGHLKLEKRGKNYVGLCPFHNEKTPSFTVSPEKQYYHCFGCGASGDLFSFVMQLENLSFMEAVQHLAGRFGITLIDEKKNIPEVNKAKNDLKLLNELAVKYYSHVLNTTSEGEEALRYLVERGINASSIETFELGFAPFKWDGFLQVAQKKGYDMKMLEKGGLVVARNDNKGYYDRFRRRIMFPIKDRDGSVIGFGGRAFGEDNKGPKYLNSPTTILFDKGRALYGIFKAKDAIRSQKSAMIMEGYTDVIMACQEGFNNVVASLGTALTTHQARHLRMQVDVVFIAYDADAAGEAAADRGLSILHGTGCQVKVVRLPDGSDPDSYLREKGRVAFEEVLNNAEPLVRYRLNNLRKLYNLKDETGRMSYIRGAIHILAEVEDTLEREDYLRSLAEETGLPEEALRVELKKNRGKGRKTRDIGNNLQKIGQTNNIPVDVPVDAAEKVILSLLFANEGVFDRLVEKIKGEEYFSPYTQKILQACKKLREEDREISMEGLDHCLDGEGQEFLMPLRRLAAVTCVNGIWDGLNGDEISRTVDDCLKRLERERIQFSRREIESKIKELEREKSGEKHKEIRSLLGRWESLKMAEQDVDRSG